MPGEDRARPEFLNFGECGGLDDPCRWLGPHSPVFRPSPSIARGSGSGLFLGRIAALTCRSAAMDACPCEQFVNIDNVWRCFSVRCICMRTAEPRADERHGLGSPIGRGLPASPGSSLTVGAGRHACGARWSRTAPTIFSLGFGGPWPWRAEARRSSRRQS